MKTRTYTSVTLLSYVAVAMLVASCGMINSKNKGKGVNLFTVEQDKQFGAQVAAEIDGNPAEYPILDSASNLAVYKYIYDIRNKILNSGNVDYKDEFSWRIRIVQNDSVLNAFCTPGGYIYVYTGILKYLDNEAQLAGVMGHEMGHADMRHSTRQMTSMFGVQVMLDVIAGNREALKQVSGALIGLKFSRSHEQQADECSVKYLCPTEWDAAGGAGFFEKIQAEGGARTPEFLSTHPDPGNRIEAFINTKTTMGCQGTQTNATEYKAMIAKLP
ncbi:MAG: M48 family metalloprotease [Bacteroidota bacterium]